ncbi:MAG: DUF4214 domain-containing protein [Pyrinomonadaceae bacterium]|nr:DUF4214 domain-containing protein [Pyrinomonadaceae bacterium]
MRIAIAVLVIALSGLSVLAQGPPTLRIVTEVPNLPSELFYGDIRVKPLRLRPGTNTPITINDADFFVHQQYVDFLSRMPDISGFNFWVNEITACGSNATCIALLRNNTSGAFFLSIEFQQTGYLVERLYKVAYGDGTGTSTLGGSHQISVPIIRRSEFQPDSLDISRDVVVGQSGWPQVLEANTVAFINTFVGRSRFITAYPAGMSALDFVNTLNTNAGNPLSPAERDQLVSELNSGTKTRAQVLRAVAEDSDLATAEKNKAFVLMQYFGYLRRNANEGNDSDYTGYDFWLQKLNTHNGDFHAAEMVRAFILSTEYNNRF